MNLTQISNHNGDINNEARMITAVQRDSGYPLMFRAVPGNIVDVSTLSRTITLLSEYGMPTDLSLLDAGYFSDDNVDLLYKAGVDFVTRLPERNRTLYNEILKKGQPALRRKENLVKFRDRYVYVKRIECHIGKKKNLAYAYIGYDVDGSGDTNHKVITSSRKKAKSLAAMHDAFESAGIFILISSIAFAAEEILDVYYIRQQVEQYFDISKGISKLTPLRVHTEQRVLGHLLLCQIAATINLAIQKRMDQYFENREGMFMALRNQKCEVFAERIVTYEGQSDANQFYKKLKIDYPISFIRRKDAWIPSDTIPSPPQENS
jgi:transposase